jgi:arylsulfatase A-like enzyme
MRLWLALLALFCTSCPGVAPLPSPTPATPGRRNVLLITIDTLRADHLGSYGYPRATSPNIDALARRGVRFEHAYTYWPKTRGSFVVMMTGRRPSQSGYGKSHPVLLDFNATLASTLKAAGYATAAAVDNANVAAQHGYAKGFDSYLETWEDPALLSEMDKARAITAHAKGYLAAARADQPFLLWLHYVNPHGPYTPPAPFDTAFLEADQGPLLPVVPGFHGGVTKAWAVPGQRRLGYYVSQYDGEIAAADREVGEVLAALDKSAVAAGTLVVLTSDHGESLGEHDYYFDHGEDLFDPCLEIPLVMAGAGVPPGRTTGSLASTIDLLPTLLEAAGVSYPPDLGGASVWPAASGTDRRPQSRLYAQNDRNLSAAFDLRYKLVAAPEGDRARFSLFDRETDPAELQDIAARSNLLREWRRALELFQERSDGEWGRTRALLQGRKGVSALSPAACEQMKALGYLPANTVCPVVQ